MSEFRRRMVFSVKKKPECSGQLPHDYVYELDGVDIGNSLRAVNISMAVNQPTTVSLEFYATVHLDEVTAEVLAVDAGEQE